MTKKNKGFTLVEMLIVLIVVGILAGLIMISSGSASDKAEATKIVSNMKTIRSACLLYYAEHGKWPDGLGSGSNNIAGENTTANTWLKDYVDSSIGSEYCLVKPTGGNNEGSIFVKYIGASKLSAGVREQLVLMAPRVNLWNSSAWGDSDHQYYKGNDTFHLPIYLTK
ncbi:MAG: type II secretion system protein [Synergistaceae bacterium]|nr:type II secretion system protein [Synergistaceae bacterium]